MKMAERDIPAVFYDGESETNMGTVRVNSSMNFKSFQLGLSQRIGISPNQITVYIVDNRTLPEPRRKIPVTSKTNFSLLTRESECHFLVVLKRSRKNRRAVAAERWSRQQREMEFSERMRELQIQKENYAAAMNTTINSRFLPGLDSFPTICESLSCKECEIARRHGKMAPFHHCICDTVVKGGFRSKAGPIAPPLKHVVK